MYSAELWLIRELWLIQVGVVCVPRRAVAYTSRSGLCTPQSCRLGLHQTKPRLGNKHLYIWNINVMKRFRLVLMV